MVIAHRGLSAQAPTDGIAWANEWYARINAALDANQPRLADSLLTVSLDSAQLLYGPHSTAEAELLDIAGTVKSYLGDTRGREAMARRAIRVSTVRYGERHRKTAMAHILLAGSLMQTHKNLDSVEILIRAAFATLSQLGLERTEAHMLGFSTLGEYYKTQSRLLEAETSLRGALEVEAAIAGDTTSNYAAGCNNLATLYEMMERFDDAEAYYRRSVTLTRKLVGSEHPDYALLLKNFGIFYLQCGKLDQAEPRVVEALGIARRALPPGHYRLAVFLWGVSDVYERLGQFDRMLPLLQEAHDNCLSNFGPKHRWVVHALNKLGLYYEYKDDDARAETYYRQAVETLEAMQQTENEDYTSFVANLARVQRFQKREAEALATLGRGRDIAVRLLGAEHPRVFQRYTRHLVYSCLESGQVDRAAALTLPLGPAVAAAYGDSSRRMAEWAILAARVSAEMGRTDDALRHLEHAFANLRIEAASTFSFLSFAQKESYVQAIDRFFNEIIYLGHRFPGNVRACGFLYNVLLFRKSLLVDAESILLQRWRRTPDPVQRGSLLDYYALRQQVITLESRPAAQQYDLPELRMRLEQTEKKLAGTAGVGWRGATTPNNGWKDVQAALQRDEAAVEFVLLPAAPPAPARYAALVLRPGTPGPDMVLLGEAATIDTLFTGAGARPLAYAESLYGKGNAGRILYSLLWEPLQALLADSRRVYFAPFGPLHQLNFRALPHARSGLTLGEQYDLVALTTTRRLAEADFARPVDALRGRAVLLGGLNYETEAASPTTVSLNPAEATGLQPDRGGAWRWPGLPETRREVLAIDSLLRRRSVSVQLLTGTTGTEGRLKAACSPESAPAIVHLATHGFFYAQPKTPATGDPRPGFLYSQNPLLRSGLVLAGANPTWTATALPTNGDDGILTAEEVSLLNLDGTALVVLSACETGLGEARSYEGLYGLQRAFRVAGARALVMTLWRVPDQPTRELMVHFYAVLADGATVRQAFDAAIRRQRATYGAAYYWAGFVLVEG